MHSRRLAFAPYEVYLMFLTPLAFNHNHNVDYAYLRCVLYWYDFFAPFMLCIAFYAGLILNPRICIILHIWSNIPLFHLYLWFQFTFLILDLDPDPCLLNPSLVLHQPGMPVLQCSWCGAWCNAWCSSWCSAWCGAWFGMSVSNGALRRLTRNWSPSIQMQKSFKVHQYAPCVHT